LDFDQLLTAEKMYNYETLYTAKLTPELNGTINLQELMYTDSVKQIRA
jgi:hypothetical protein